MTGTVRFNSKAALRDWLKEKPHPWAQAIASRVALRVLPAIVRSRDTKSNRKEIPERLIVSAARAILVSSVALVQRTPATIAAADDAAYAAIVAADAAAYAAAAAADAAYGAVIVDGAYSYAADATATAADAYADVDAYADTIWRSVSDDATWLAAADDISAPERGILLLRQPLWQCSAPDTLRTAWSHFANSSIAVEHGFQAWIRWYEALASLEDGRPPQPVFSDILSLRIATQPDE